MGVRQFVRDYPMNKRHRSARQRSLQHHATPWVPRREAHGDLRPPHGVGVVIAKYERRVVDEIIEHRRRDTDEHPFHVTTQRLV